MIELRREIVRARSLCLSIEARKHGNALFPAHTRLDEAGNLRE